MVCCVQVAWLVEFLIENHRELFEEEVAGLSEAPPAPGAEAETSEVCQGHKEHDNKIFPAQKVGLLPQGHPPACSSAKMQSKDGAGWPSHFVWLSSQNWVIWTQQTHPRDLPLGAKAAMGQGGPFHL